MQWVYGNLIYFDNCFVDWFAVYLRCSVGLFLIVYGFYVDRIFWNLGLHFAGKRNVPAFRLVYSFDLGLERLRFLVGMFVNMFVICLFQIFSLMFCVEFK